MVTYMKTNTRFQVDRIINKIRRLQPYLYKFNAWSLCLDEAGTFFFLSQPGKKTRTLNFQVNHEKRINEILNFKNLQVVSVINIKKLKPLDLDLVFYVAFVKFTKQLLIFVHLLDLYCLQLGQLLIKLLSFKYL